MRSTRRYKKKAKKQEKEFSPQGPFSSLDPLCALELTDFCEYAVAIFWAKKILFRDHQTPFSGEGPRIFKNYTTL